MSEATVLCVACGTALDTLAPITERRYPVLLPDRKPRCEPCAGREAERVRIDRAVRLAMRGLVT